MRLKPLLQTGNEGMGPWTQEGLAGPCLVSRGMHRPTVVGWEEEKLSESSSWFWFRQDLDLSRSQAYKNYGPTTAPIV